MTVDKWNQGGGERVLFRGLAQNPKINGSKFILKDTSMWISPIGGEANIFRADANTYFRMVKEVRVLQATRKLGREHTFNLSWFFTVGSTLLNEKYSREFKVWSTFRRDILSLYRTFFSYNYKVFFPFWDNLESISNPVYKQRNCISKCPTCMSILDPHLATI